MIVSAPGGQRAIQETETFLVWAFHLVTCLDDITFQIRRSASSKPCIKTDSSRTSGTATNLLGSSRMVPKRGRLDGSGALRG